MAASIATSGSSPSPTSTVTAELLTEEARDTIAPGSLFPLDAVYVDESRSSIHTSMIGR